MDRDALMAMRAAAIERLDPQAEAYDLVAPLVEVDKAAVAAGDTAFSQQLRVEIQAAGTHAGTAGTPESSARFDFVTDELRRPEAVAIIAAAGAEGPPLVRAHFLDLVWSVESSPRAHPLAGRKAAEAYLAYDAAIGATPPSADADASAWARWADALARACELARETGQRDLAQQATAVVKKRLAQAITSGDYRIVLEPGYGLLRVARLVPDALDGVPAWLRDARAGLLGSKKFHLARSVVDLEIAVARAIGSPDALPDLQRAKADAFVAEADDREAGDGRAFVAGIFIQQAIAALSGVPDSAARIQELTRRLEGSNRAAGEQMGTVSGQVSIPTADLERFYRAFTDVPIPDSLGLIGDHFLFDRAREYATYDERAKQFVLTQLMSHELITDYGETMTFAPGTPEFRDYGVFRQAAQGMSFSRVFLREIFSRLRAKGMDASHVITYLDECSIFDPPTRTLLYDGVRRIFADDHVGAVHVLVPRLEATIRSLVAGVGLPVTRVNAQGSEMLLLKALLTSLRRSEALEDRFVFTLEVALDRLGWNIRNEVAHGWITPESCSPTTSDRLLQLVLALGLLRLQQRPTK